MPTRKVTPVVGLPQFNGWSHVVNHVDNQGLHLVAAFAISGKQAGNVGRSITERITSARIFQAADLHALLSDLLVETTRNGCKLYFSGGVLRGPAKGCFAVYGGAVHLKRGERFGQLVKAQNSPLIVSGQILDDDIFVFSTNPTSLFINEIKQKFTQGYEVDTIITSIVPGIHGQSDSSLASLAFITDVIEEQSDRVSLTEMVERDEQPQDFEEGSAIVSEPMTPQSPYWQPSSDMELEVLQNESEKATERTATLIPLKVFSTSLQVIRSTFAYLVTAASSIQKKIHFKKDSNAVTNEPNTLHNGPTLTALTAKRNKTLFYSIVVFAILLVLAVTVYVTIHRRQNQIFAAEQLLAPIYSENKQAQEQVQSDPLTARTVVSENIIELQNLSQKHSDDAILHSRITEALNETQALLEEISGQEEVDQLSVFYDLRLVSTDFISTNAHSSGEIAAFVDQQTKSVLLLNLESKQVKLVQDASTEEIKDVTVFSDTALFLANGIQAVTFDGEATVEEKIAIGDSNRAGTLLAAFDRFIYVLNPEKRVLYRYSEDDGSYSEPIGWFKSSQGIDFSTISSMAIDGDVWIGTQSGEVFRFTAGESQAFDIQGIPSELTSPIRIHTSDSLENLYILEPEKKRLVILSKDGVFIRQIESSSLASATGLFANEQLKKAFAVSGSIVFEIPL